MGQTITLIVEFDLAGWCGDLFETFIFLSTLCPHCLSASWLLQCYCVLSSSSPDPFADATKGDDRLPAGTDDYIHIRIQQRNGRKTLTTVQGIAADYDKKKLVKAFKKVLAWCGVWF